MTLELQNRIALGIAVLATLGSVGWFGGGEVTVARDLTSQESRPMADPLAEVLTASMVSATPAVQRWDKPAAPAQGKVWNYDVFTPPEIGFDTRVRQFVIGGTPTIADLPGASDRGGGDHAEFGLSLLAVTRVPFRLQLVGYVGTEAGRKGVFENKLTGETLLAGAGRQLDKLELVVESFTVTPVPLSLQHLPTTRPVASAVIRDIRTGERIVLTDQAPTYTDALVATVSSVNGNGSVSEVREGEEVAHRERLTGLERSGSHRRRWKLRR